MKTLIYNNENDSNHLTNILCLLDMEILVDNASNYNDGLLLYNSYNYDLVFIDYIEHMGKDFIEYILKNNPLQRIITTSDVHESSVKFGNDFCIDNYKKERLLKPIDIKDIIKIYKNKDYLFEDYPDDIKHLKLMQINKYLKINISGLRLDLNSLTFINSTNNICSKGFFFIIEKLDLYNFNFKVDVKGNITVL